MVGMLTTTDNPWSPFTQYDEWDAFDRVNNYNSNSYLARMLGALTPFTTEEDIDSGIDTILAMPPSGIYEKVYETDFGPNAERAKRFMKRQARIDGGG